MTKNADFGPNLAIFGPKSLIFMGVSKSFGINITENHPDNLSALFFGLPPSEVEECHRGRIRRMLRLKLEDRELKRVDVLVRKFAVVVQAVPQISSSICRGNFRGFQNGYQLPFP